MRIYAGTLAIAMLGMTMLAPAAVHAADPPANWSAGLRWMQPSGFRSADLAGHIVIVEFWTLGCYNCRRTIPAMRALDALALDGVTIAGIHTPEFEAERDPRALARVLKQERIRFPVAQDNDSKVWNSFGNEYWPALYVLDRQGHVRLTHIGELHVGTDDWKHVLQVIDTLRRERSPRG